MNKEKNPTTQIGYLLLTCTLLYLAPKPAWGVVQNSQKDSVLRIYLPREVTIEDNNLKLGQVSIIRGEESLVAKASEITLGRISVPGQKVVVDRTTALSRLACSGIPVSNVTITGAEKVTVKRQHQVIKGSNFVELASSFLKSKLPANSIYQISPVWMPKDLVLPGLNRDVRLSPRMVQISAENQAKVRIVVFSDGKEAGTQEVTFRLKYNRRTIAALVDIPAGEALSPENVKIEKAVSNYPEPVNWSPPYGFIARRQIPANTTISQTMIGSAESVAVGRNETVVIRIERPGFLITALGKAMQKGEAGEFIKVRNLDSQRIILAKINEDGTVAPIF